jgi:hypothetical protein
MISALLRNVILASLVSLAAACGGGGSTPPPLVDTDKDGTPDAQDVAPNDPLCAASSDAAGGICYVRLLAASRLKVVGQANGKIFFSSEDDALRLYGYDLTTRHFLGRASISGYTPTTYAYSADHARIYVGDTTGKIHSYSESLQESATVFASVPSRVNGLAAAGKYLMVQDDTGAWVTHWVFDKQGIQTDAKDWNYYSTNYEWNQATSTLYFFRDDSSPNDLMFEVIDQSTGKLTSNGETPYHGAYNIRGPIRANAAGNKVLLGTGDVYGVPGLNWQGNFGGFSDAAWIANDELITMSAPTLGKTRLSRFTASKVKAEEITIDGEVLAISVVGNANYLVVKKTDSIAFLNYVVSNDSDGDGVPNLEDKFPLDKTAAVDTDNDGYPDAFLGSYTAADSPTGLTKDFYPADASCHALDQGNGTTCNYAAVIPSYAADMVISDKQGIIYLLSKANFRVYRWSPALRDYIAPLVIGQPVNTVNKAPTAMSYSPEHHRLYLGYASGQVTYIGLAGDTRETPFASVASSVGGVAAVGNFVLVQDDSGAWNTHYIFDRNGVLTDSKDWNYRSNWYDWGTSQSRVYFFRDDTSPNDLMFENIDQTTGKITAAGDSPYHGEYSIRGPIRVSAGGGRVLTGAGQIYSGSDLTVVGSLGFICIDAQWLDDGSLVVMSANGADAKVTLYNPLLQVVKNQVVTGTPVALLKTGASVTAVTQISGKPNLSAVPL